VAIRETTKTSMSRASLQNRRASRTALLIVAVLALLYGTACSQEQPAWWNRNWRYRKLLKVTPKQGAVDALSARVWIHVREGADHGGRDLRVVSPDGDLVAFDIVHSTKDGRYLLTFQIIRRRDFYAVYYDNPAAADVSHVRPKAGLLHYTMPVPEGLNSTREPDVLRTVEAAGGLYGMDYWPRVHDAYNPFGPQQDYVAVYRGYIQIAKRGQYRIATLSEHSSYLFVDDKLVVKWPGAHSIWSARRGQRHGRVNLTVGKHPFLYVHFSYGRPMRCSAAWSLPGESAFVTIPPAVFLNPVLMEVYETQREGQPACADFEFTPTAYCEAGEAKMVALRFGSRSSTGGDALVGSYRWDFGDGQTSGGAQPEHVFLTPGLHIVKLAIRTTDRKTAGCAKSVHVEPVWNDMDFRQPKLDRFHECVKRYALGALPTPALLSAWEFFRSIEQEGDATAALMQLDRRRKDLDPSRTSDIAMALAEYHQQDGQSPQKAEEYLNMALDTVPLSDRGRRQKARFALCDHLFYYGGQPERARQEYVKLRADFPQEDKTINRIALIRIGDTYCIQGKLTEALDAYRQAESDPAHAPARPRPVVTGAIKHEVQAYVSKGEGEEALKRLEELLWFYPSMRLEGEPTLLRVRAALVKGDYGEAKKHADTYISFANDRNWLPPLHMAAAEACVEMGLTDEAAEHYRAILDGFKEAPEVQAASDGLRRLGK
jgi:tetratricopeptide (TPR) repeat protein